MALATAPGPDRRTNRSVVVPQLHFGFLEADLVEDLFFKPPETFASTSDRELLAHGLGATLYTPGTHPELSERLHAASELGVASNVICLEDSIADDEVDFAQRNVVTQLTRATSSGRRLPLLFIRTRTPRHLTLMAQLLGPLLSSICGFVAPKFSAAQAPAWFAALAEASSTGGARLYLMPVLETEAVLHSETRVAELGAIAELCDTNRDRVLAMRVGVTDLCGLLGLRRSPYETVYDIATLRDCLGDITNTFLRAGRRYVVSGGVWEYFAQDERMFRPQLRQSMFGDGGQDLRDSLLEGHLDGLMTEVSRDLANGLLGKTVVHPSHVRTVNALHVVSHEQYVDAQAILASPGGASASTYRNKMNETGPHRSWAEGIETRARVFGVLAEGTSTVRLLAAGVAA